VVIDLKLMILCPITSESFRELTETIAKRVCRKDVEIEVVKVEKGPASIESTFETVMAEPFAVEKIKEGEERGFDAVVISCMCDCGLRPGRELVEIPVTGALESSVLLASSLGQKFSIVTISKGIIPLFQSLIRSIGLEANLTSIRSVEIPVLELRRDLEKTKNALLSEARKAVKEDGAHVVILGCTGMTGMAHWLQKQLNLPVIDPLAAAIKLAESLVDLKLTHSKLTYPHPPQKEIRV